MTVPCKLDWGWPDAAELRNRRRRLNAPIDGPYRRPGWLSRLARWLGWMAGAQIALAMLGGCEAPMNVAPQSREQLAQRFAKTTDPFAEFVRDVDVWLAREWWGVDDTVFAMIFGAFIALLAYGMVASCTGDGWWAVRWIPELWRRLRRVRLPKARVVA